MKILRLSAENIKRLSVVEIQPDGAPVIVIGGKNGAGKSSVLDSIAMALGGAELIPGKPIRKGQARGKVTVDLGDLVVTRTFTEAGGGTLVVANKDGARYPSPQAMLDKLIGRLSFDPLAFERMPAKQQRDTLRALVGLDTSDVDAIIKALYDERTAVNRLVKQQEGQLAAMPSHEGVPTEPVSIADLAAELDAADVTRRALETARAEYDAAVKASEAAGRIVEQRTAAIATVRQQLAELEANLQIDQDRAQLLAAATETAREAGVAAKAAVIDPAPIRSRIAEADAVNAKVRANQARTAFEATIEKDRVASKAISDKLVALEEEKQTRLAAVAFPVPGLSLDDDGVTFDGLPFEQASQAQRLRASVAIGLALNPRLKVLLVHEGSSLDSASLQLLGELAAAADAQVWLEAVRETPGVGVSVFIEDGTVRVDDQVAETVGAAS